MRAQNMFTQSAHLYDAIYYFKDYAQEVERLVALVGNYNSGAKTLLDVACGTGKHLECLQSHYQVEGLDLNDEFLQTARERLPEVPLHRASMLDFNFDRGFDVVTCLFSSIGYVQTTENLHQTIGNMARHLNPGGALMVEPWFYPDTYYPGRVHANFVNEPELKIARMTVSAVDGQLSIMDMHYLVGTPDGIRQFNERHALGLFTHDEYVNAIEAAGLQVHFDEPGLMGRGLYIGVRV